MLWLPGAERERRALLLGVVLLLGLLLSWWPSEKVESGSNGLVGLYALPLVQVASWIESRVAGSTVESPTSPAPPAGWLDQTERAAARPMAVRGMAWIEVPVLGVERGGTALRLSAGSEIGLAEGMIAACGSIYLGRLSEVEPGSALLLHFRAADQRTGVRLQVADGETRDAILIGRAQLAPVLNWIEGGWRPDAELKAEVSFRGRREDPPALASAGLRLGSCAREVQRGRNEPVWVVEGAWPRLAEGRVFVAAGALPEKAVRPVAPPSRSAHGLLTRDAVLGSRLQAFTTDSGFAPEIVTRGSRVLGAVVQRRGTLIWARADAVADWVRSERALQPQTVGERAFGFFTRGGNGVPRGLWLGQVGDSAPTRGEALALRAPSATDR